MVVASLNILSRHVPGDIENVNEVSSRAALNVLIFNFSEECSLIEEFRCASKN